MSLVSKLAELAHISPPILTAYIDVNPAHSVNQSTPRGYVKRLKAAGQELNQDLPEEMQKPLRRQLRRVDHYLRLGKPRGQSLVIFAGPKTWELIPLQVEVIEELHWGKASLQQMAWILDEHRPRGAVVIDGSGARFFTFWLGTVDESPQYAFSFDISSWRKPYLVGPSTPGVSKQHGIQRDRVSARTAEQRRHFLKKLSPRILEWSQDENISPIVLIGNAEEVETIIGHLPASLRTQIVIFPKALPQVAASEVAKRLNPILGRWEREYEAQVIEDLIAGLHTGQSVVGLPKTLEQLQKANVRELVVARGLTGSAKQCSSCGWVDKSSDRTCPVCGSERQTRTLRTLVPELASRYSVPLEVIAGQAGATLLEKGGIAGWLRSAKRRPRHKLNALRLSSAS